jgi:hypothetical protein
MKDAVAELSLKRVSNDVIGKERALGARSIPLNSVFGSYGEALHAWLSSSGFGYAYSKHDDRAADWNMVVAFCSSLQITHSTFATRTQMQSYEYFESVDWAIDWLRAQGFFQQDTNSYLFLDEGNRPVARVSIYEELARNFSISFHGDAKIGSALREEIKKHICVDEADRDKPSYWEVVLTKISSGDKAPDIIQRYVQNPREVIPEFYPYLEGGASNLIAEFMESDDCALILMGPPGTGKSSSISAAITDLNLVPIYVKSTEVAEHPDFVSFVMWHSDSFMRKAQEGETGRAGLIKQKFWDHPSRASDQMLTKTEEDNRIPVIVVEDAGALIAPIKEGNKLMSNLLNELDGIGSALSRKIIFTTNLTSTKNIDEALLRPGRCYDAVTFPLLTPAQAIAARKAAGLPAFEVVPTKDISLAEAVRKPRKKISIERAKNKIGFCG